MMDTWRKLLGIDPIPALLNSGNQAVVYFAKRDLLRGPVDPIQTLWELPEAQKLLRRQNHDGSWKYPGKKGDLRSPENYSMLETYRSLGILIEKYGFNLQHPAIPEAANFLFSCQTEEGDFRGIYGTQYSPNYTAAILELLIKSGYEGDQRVKRGLEWLLSIRQEDGGWAIAMRTTGMRYRDIVSRPDPLQPNRSKPFSHMVTGIVLRAFAAHPHYRQSQAAKQAASLLASRFFRSDPYPDRRSASYWESVSFPFWFTDIISALDSLSLVGFGRENPHVSTALEWLEAR